MVEHLPRKCEALSSNTSTPKKKKKKRIESEICLLVYLFIYGAEDRIQDFAHARQTLYH
jgi:hypothetical protein